jgi:membrane-associated phospholipid phosphatase
MTGSRGAPGAALRRGLWVAGWAALLVLAFRVDRFVYLEVAGAVAEETGDRPWRFGRPEGGSAPALVQVLTLFKRMGEIWFVILVAVTMLLLAPGRRGQVLALCLAIGVAALAGQALLKPAVGKLRPDAELLPADLERLVARGGEMAVVHGRTHNRGSALFRPPFSGAHGELAFPSGHTALAFAAFAVLGRAFRRAKWWFLFLACGVGASRVLMGEHFLSDVVGGAGVGYACARAVLAVPRIGRFMAAA